MNDSETDEDYEIILEGDYFNGNKWKFKWM